ncbi:MAG: ATP-binding protein [Saprospiraceae bacterium]|nr:ATP-binding protein [Saprospiraceae bacterium]
MIPASLIIITGLPGTGKTTLATALAQRLDAHHCNTDMIRSDLGLRGQYDSDTKQQVYLALLESAKGGLQTGNIVVIDGTFYQAQLRSRFDQLARSQAVPIHWVELWAEPDLIQKRVSKTRTYSEADFEVYLKIKAAYEPILTPHLRLQSDNSNLQELIEAILAHLEAEKK